MALEIERKFLVDHKLFKPTSKGVKIYQLYLKREATHSVRLRIMGPKAFFTIKTTISELVRNEFEYEIPEKDAREMFELFREMPSVEKIRFHENIDGDIWVIDQFLGRNKGLLLAEIELPSVDAAFSKPEWLLNEVTNNNRYHNSNLAVNPINEQKL